MRKMLKQYNGEMVQLRKPEMIKVKSEGGKKEI